MKNYPILVWGILALVPLAFISLGLVAWLLGSTPAEPNSTDIEAAMSSALALESTRLANQPPPTLFELAPEKFRPSPTSIAEFRVLSPTFTPISQIPVIYGDPALILGPFSWINSFEEEALAIEGDSPCTSASFLGGRMQVIENGEGDENCTVLVQPESPEYYLEVSLVQKDACSNGEFGLFVHGLSGGEGALFGVTCDGGYSLLQSYSDRGGLFLSQGLSDSINSGPGQENRIGVLARGDKISLYANGGFLGEITEPIFLEGKNFGLFVRTKDGGPISVEFDNLTFWDLSK